MSELPPADPHRTRRRRLAILAVLAGMLGVVTAGAPALAAESRVQGAVIADAPVLSPAVEVAPFNSATVGPTSAQATGAPATATTAAASARPGPVSTLRTGEQLGTLRIPRFGVDWSTTIAEGTDEHTVLASNVGHYPGTAMPGGDGNFALAGHRTSYHAQFFNISSLVVGDAMIIETPEGWYAYRYRSSEYVQPTAVDVLNAVPRLSQQPAGKYITLTACNPLYSTAERLIAYGVFESFTPRP